jgi:pilus assembly protein CpaE
MKRLSGRWKHLIVCPDRGLFNSLTAILSELTPGSVVTDLKAYPARRTLSDLLEKEEPNLCFLDVGSSWDSALGIINELNSITSSIPVVAISSGNDPDIILRSLRQGASEFLFQPFAIEQVGAALDRLMRLKQDTHAGPRELGRVYCVMPGKGACGASTVACNLAFHMQRNNPEQKILLADLDASTGMLAFLLKLKSTHSFVDALTHASQMDEDLWKAIVNQHQGVDVVLCPENPVESFAIHEGAAMIDYIRETYGISVLDVGGAFGDWPEQIARLCDELILVTTNELPALHSTQRAIVNLERNGIERGKIKLVVNRYDGNLGLDREAITTALGLDIFHILPNDPDSVQKSLLEGKALPANSSLGKHYAHMAVALGGGRKTEVKRQSRFGGLFSVFDSVLNRS